MLQAPHYHGPKVHHDSLRFCQRTLHFLSGTCLLPTEVMIKKNDATRRQQRRWPSCCPGSHTGHNRKGHLTWPESHLRHPVRASIGMVPHDCGIAPPVTTTRVVRALRLYKHLEWQHSTSRLLTWSLGSILLPHGTESCRPHHMEQLCPSNPPTLSGHNFMISC